MTPEEIKFHEHFMAMAIREADHSLELDEIPCGCIIVQMPEPYFDKSLAKRPTLSDPWTGRVIARAHNQTEMLHDPTAHAEMIAITAAASSLDASRLSNCIVYVTKEPCPMCAGALIWARPEIIIWGFSDPDRGGEHQFGILSSAQVNHHAVLHSGILEKACKEQFQSFFQAKRKDKYL